MGAGLTTAMPAAEKEILNGGEICHDNTIRRSGLVAQ
jgi:hypothetical protein